ncbi:MAG TPA: hypothetical protein DCR07_00825 [Lactococcus sp.]|nr:hypothetical protein [Lactococcus sp.]
MAPGTIFTMANEQYRYLENQGGGNHLIIRNEGITNVSWVNQETRTNEWYDALDTTVRAMVRPVVIPEAEPVMLDSDVTWMTGHGTRWLPTNIEDFPEVANDVSRVDTSGSSRAFSLSLADIVRLSGPERAFTNLESRGADVTFNWWLRTRGGIEGDSTVRQWGITGLGSANPRGSVGGYHMLGIATGRALRPALIVHQ